MSDVISVELNNYEQISRREAMSKIEKGEIVVCRLIRKERVDTCKLSTMDDLSEVVITEQKLLCDKLEFYKEIEN